MSVLVVRGFACFPSEHRGLQEGDHRACITAIIGATHGLLGRLRRATLSYQLAQHYFLILVNRALLSIVFVQSNNESNAALPPL